ncbi:hypothetical protein GLYMA_U007603v4 [Glycine max]|nr:hypothetical protein GLYMA_U007603v4 [Glycine max]KAH1154286.1 hypothetical protein GYH30_049798 [Glycine max]
MVTWATLSTFLNLYPFCIHLNMSYVQHLCSFNEAVEPPLRLQGRQPQCLPDQPLYNTRASSRTTSSTQPP